MQKQKEYHNHLALIDQLQKDQTINQIRSSQIRAKMKCVNRLAQSDIDFMPIQPTKMLYASTLQSSSQIYQLRKQNSYKKVNAQEEGEQLWTHVVINPIKKVQSQIYPLNRQNDHSFLRYQSQIVKKQTGYCYNCDQSIDSLEHHKCQIKLNSIQFIDNKIKSLQSEANSTLLMLIKTARNLNSSQLVKSMLLTLKNIEGEGLDQWQLLVKKRLTNLLAKKMGILLNIEENEL